MKKFLLILFLLGCMMTPVFAQGEVVRVTKLVDVIENYWGGSSGLSPDGSMVAFISRADDSLCIVQTSDESVSCTLFTEAAQRVQAADRLAWSPDSTKIAMTEEFPRRFDEPDIWIFDVAAQSFTNLTDDETTASFLSPEAEDAMIDLFPVWSPDGSLYFQRIQDSILGRLITVQRIDVDATEPEQVSVLPEFFFQGLTLTSPAISPDGTQMAILLSNRNRDDNYGGLYTIDLDSGFFERIIVLEDLDTGTFLDHEDEPDTGRAFPPATLAWLTDETLLIVRNATGLMLTGAPAIYNHIDLSTTASSAIIDLSHLDMNEILESAASPLETSYQSYYPFFSLLSADRNRLYYATSQESDGKNFLFSLPLPPDGENTPTIEFQMEFPIMPGVEGDDFLGQMSNDARYGLLMGHYLIEFAVNSE